MTKFSKKWATITASLVLGATALGAGVATWGTGTKTVSAGVSDTGTAPANVVKLETLIDDVSTDFIINNQYANMLQDSSTTGNDAKKIVWNKGSQSSDGVQYTFSTEAGTNGNVYGGNVAYSMSKGPVGFHFKNENESVISFNTRWDNDVRFTLHMRTAKPTGNNGLIVDSSAGLENYGYAIWLRTDMTPNALCYVYTASKTKQNIGGKPNLGKDVIETGALVTVTYGIWTDDNDTPADGTDDKDIVYCKLEKVNESTGEKEVVREYWWDNAITTNTPYYCTAEGTADTSYSSIVFGGWNGATNSMTIEGVSQPLTTLSTTVSETYGKGEDIANVVAPAGYTITSTGTLAKDKNVLNASYSGSYYGQPYQTDTATVIVNTVNYDCTVEGTYAYGTAISELALPEGYAFNTTATRLTKIGRQELAGTYTTEGKTYNVTISVNVTRKVTNIEDLVDEYSDIYVKGDQLGEMQEVWNQGEKTVQITSKYSTTYNVSTKATDEVTEYNGNIVSYSDDSIGYWLMNTDENSVTSVITQWPSSDTTKTNEQLTFRMRGSRFTEESIGGMLFDSARNGDGYYVVLRPSMNQLLFRYRTAVKALASPDTVYINKTEVLEDIAAGDPVKFTFGVTTDDQGTLDTADDKDILYFAVSPINKDTGEIKATKEFTYTIDSSNVYYASETERYTALVYGRPDAVTATVAFEGVERPIFENGYDTTAEEGTYKEGAQLSTVALPSNYTWKNGNEVLKGDEDTYEATYALTYYGKSVSLPVLVRVNVQVIRHTAVFQRADGTEISRTAYEENTTVELPTATLSAGKTVALGWLKGEDLYPVGYEYEVGTLSASEEAVYTLVEIDFAMADGAGVRLVKNGEYGGLRYIVQSSDIDEWFEKYATGIYGLLVPYETEYYDNGFTEEALTKAKALSNRYTDETDYAGYQLYSFAMTDILYSNYNRQFVGGAYITVSFADGTTGKIFTPFAESKNVRSIYDVALKAYADHLAKMNEQTAAGNTPVGLYGTDGVAMLKDYIFDVVDITIDMTTGAVTLSDGVNGLLEALPYTVAPTTATLKGGSASVYVFELTVSDMPEVEDETRIPVLVRIYNNGEYVGTARAVTPVGEVNGETITITFEQDVTAIEYLVEME